MKIGSLFAFLVILLSNTLQAADLSNRDAFQRPENIPFPSSNPLTIEKSELGKTLFFDIRLSRNQEMSCATCHAPDKKWRDGRKIPLGAENIEKPRTTPTLLNSAWLTTLMWDGRAKSLEDQAILPITTEHEMNFEMAELVERLQSVAGYRPLFLSAFGDDEITEQRITQALASFQRTLVSQPSTFDNWINGNESALDDDAKRGFELFNGKALCVNCHQSWRFTDDSFHDIGLSSDDLGRGAFVPMQVVIMQHAFKTPSLRDLPEKGPFMHDGSMHSLQEVIKHYENGGISRVSLSAEMQPFELTDAEREDLVAFIKSLTGPVLEIEFPNIPE